MHSIIGILFHSLGGVASGSFYMPFNKVKLWKWESFWIVGGFFSWLIVPLIIASLTLPGFWSVISSGAFPVLAVTFSMGVLWGIGGLTYGLGIRYLGMSLGNSVVLGFCSAFGALVPPVYYYLFPTEGKESILEMVSSSGGVIVLAGVIVCLIGIAICGRAGVLKEGELSDSQKKESVAEFNLGKGLLIAIISGVLSSFFNFGIEAGKELAESVAMMPDALFEGSSSLFQNNVTFVVILWGGFLTNFIWTTILSIKNGSYRDFLDMKAPLAKNYIFSALAGTIWFLQFFFYGMGESKLGNGASSWILHMSAIILTSNLWGIYRREWNGTSAKTKWTIFSGIGIILLSVVLVGIGNSL